MTPALTDLLIGLRQNTTLSVEPNYDSTHLVVSKKYGDPVPVAYLNETLIRSPYIEDPIKYTDWFTNILTPTQEELTMYSLEIGEEFVLAPYYKEVYDVHEENNR